MEFSIMCVIVLCLLQFYFKEGHESDSQWCPVNLYLIQPNNK